MWLFIIYSIIGYLFYTFYYFYLSNKYEFVQDIREWKKCLIIIGISLLAGLIWPLFLLITTFMKVYNLKKK